MNNPWLKFYPADWRADPALRMCSLAARGLWMDMLCLMHEAKPYGSLLVNGVQVTIKQLATLCGVPLRDVQSRLSELENSGVFSREDDGTIYSRRMRRDCEKAERDKANGKGGGNPHLKGGVNPQDKAQKLEARSQSPEARGKEERARGALRLDWPSDFADQFWRQYPHKVGRGDAIKKLGKLARDGPVAFDELMAALHRYAAKTDDRPWCNPATWLNQQRWLDQPAANNGNHNGKSGRKTVHDILRDLDQRFSGEAGEDDDGVLPLR